MSYTKTIHCGPAGSMGRRGSLICSLAGAFILVSADSAQAQAQPLPPQLVGTWYWETSTYVSAGDYSTIIRSTRTIRINSDGTFVCVETGTHNGTRTYQGRLTVQGDQLTARDAQGRTLTLRFALRGNNGLLLNGVLYERR